MVWVVEIFFIREMEKVTTKNSHPSCFNLFLLFPQKILSFIFLIPPFLHFLTCSSCNHIRCQKYSGNSTTNWHMIKLFYGFLFPLCSFSSFKGKLLNEAALHHGTFAHVNAFSFSWIFLPHLMIWNFMLQLCVDTKRKMT